MSDDPIEFLLPWQDAQAELTLEEASDPSVIHQRLIAAMVEKRIDEES